MLDYVDLFAGAGGWDVAARDLDMDGVGIEMDPIACATRRAAGLGTEEGDVRDYRGMYARGLIASPPCQQFSTAGLGEARHDDTALGAILAMEPLEWARVAHRAGQSYEWIALEQVSPARHAFVKIADALRTEMGYSVWTGVLDSSWYGVPQKRSRAILIASLNIEVRCPQRELRQAVMRDFIVPESVAPFDGLMPAGRSSPGKPHGFDMPAGTITAAGNATWVHCEDYIGSPTGSSGKKSSERIRNFLDRNGKQKFHGISPEEAAALQTFPAEHAWQGTRGQRLTQIGNAIPPKLALAVLVET